MLVAGGGPFADLIRAMDRVHALGDLAAHDLAMRTLDITAALLAALLGRSRVVHRAAEIETCLSQDLVPVASPARFLEELDDISQDPLPASWDVTSDSIAARLADRLGARRLILLKSVAPDGDMDRRQAARLGLVDPLFPVLSSRLDRVEVVNLRESGAGIRRLTIGL